MSRINSDIDLLDKILENTICIEKKFPEGQRVNPNSVSRRSFIKTGLTTFVGGMGLTYLLDQKNNSEPRIKAAIENNVAARDSAAANSFDRTAEMQRALGQEPEGFCQDTGREQLLAERADVHRRGAETFVGYNVAHARVATYTAGGVLSAFSGLLLGGLRSTSTHIDAKAHNIGLKEQDNTNTQ